MARVRSAMPSWENTAFYTKVATRTVLNTVISPLDKLGMFKTGEIAPAA